MIALVNGIIYWAKSRSYGNFQRSRQGSCKLLRYEAWNKKLSECQKHPAWHDGDIAEIEWKHSCGKVRLDDNFHAKPYSCFRCRHMPFKCDRDKLNRMEEVVDSWYLVDWTRECEMIWTFQADTFRQSWGRTFSNAWKDCKKFSDMYCIWTSSGIRRTFF